MARLRLGDIDWRNGILRVTGKGRYEVGLPLPQDLGDALLAYLARRPVGGDSDHASSARFRKLTLGVRCAYADSVTLTDK